MELSTDETGIKGLIVIKPKIFKDERGYFFESYNLKKYKELGLPNFVQENQSKSDKGVLRGLHFQTSPHAQGKLVRVIQGEVLDVAVDLRKRSKTYGKYFKVVLSSTNKKEMYIPKGFAHGFLVLSQTAIFSYLCTDFYHHECENGIIWNDKDINIDWGIKNPIISDKDKKNIKFQDFTKQKTKNNTK